MPSWLFVVLVTVAAVGFFVLGMSLTLMIKGHHIDSEISTNKEMQRRGIKCAVQETREADGTADCAPGSPPARLYGQLRRLRHRTRRRRAAPRLTHPSSKRAGPVLPQ